MVATVVLLVAIDLILKAWVAGQLTDGRSLDLVLIQLRVTFNSGVAFGLGAGLPTGLLLAASALITLAVIVMAWRSGAAQVAPVERIALAVVIAGALANLVDRAVDGVVTDYLHTGWFPTFNLADVFITLGASTLLLSTVVADRKAATSQEAE